MNRKYNIFVPLLLLIICFNVFFTSIEVVAGTVPQTKRELSKEEISQVEEWIKKCMNAGKIPGTSIVIVHGEDTIFKESYGYADEKEEQLVTEDTLFEMGSTSKAFTALAVLQLASEEKLDLKQSVSSYLPWFSMRYKGLYKGEEIDSTVDITIEQLIYHTSGMKTEWLGSIEAGEDENALENMVRDLSGKYLANFPGERYEYSSVNYDVLGLLIQEVSGITYEEYMDKSILDKLYLNNTYVTREEASKYDLSKGYKLGFLKAREYDAPRYRANVPAGYLFTNIQDMEKWLKIQMGTIELDSFDADLITMSHDANRSVALSEDGSYYAAGWSVFQRGTGIYAHGGSNPNYSSHIVFRTDEGYGICVLANLGSSYTDYIAQGILNILVQGSMPALGNDDYLVVDQGATILFIAFLMVGTMTLISLLYMIVQYKRGERRWMKIQTKDVIKFSVFLLFIVVVGCCLYCLPSVFYGDVPWNFVTVWAPFSLVPSVITLYLALFFLGMHYFVKKLCVKKGKAYIR